MGRGIADVLQIIKQRRRVCINQSLRAEQPYQQSITPTVMGKPVRRRKGAHRFLKLRPNFDDCFPRGNSCYLFKPTFFLRRWLCIQVKGGGGELPCGCFSFVPPERCFPVPVSYAERQKEHPQRFLEKPNRNYQGGRQGKCSNH